MANVHLGLVQWAWNGKTGYGETQDAQCNDCVWCFGQEK
jgi:hypothetical protein